MKNTTPTQFNGRIRWILVVLLGIMFCWLEATGQRLNTVWEMMDGKLTGESDTQHIITTREIVFEKINDEL